MSAGNMLLAFEMVHINDVIEGDLKKNGHDVVEFIKELDAYIATLPSNQIERTNLFILAQPVDLRVGYAANPNINNLANKWTLDCLKDDMRVMFANYGIVSTTPDESLDVAISFIPYMKAQL